MTRIFVSLFVMKQGKKKKKDQIHWEVERKLPLFFASKVMNNSFPTFTVGFDRWLRCDCKPSCSLKQYF